MLFISCQYCLCQTVSQQFISLKIVKKKSTSQQQQKMQQLIFFKFSFILLQYFSVTMAGKIINSSSNFSWRLRGVCICENGWIFKETPHGGGGLGGHFRRILCWFNQNFGHEFLKKVEGRLGFPSENSSIFANTGVPYVGQNQIFPHAKVIFSSDCAIIISENGFVHRI